ELEALVSAPVSVVETTLLIHPRVLGDFLDYNEFLGEVERLVEERGHRGVIQVASFHPAYQFADTRPDALENYTNRSPYPMLVLRREQSIPAVAGDPDALLETPRRNVQTLERLGRRKVLQMLAAVEAGLERQA